MDIICNNNRTGDRPLALVNPGAMFQDDARPGAMILGMDRTPEGRIWGCWTGTGDKRDGYMLLATSDDGGETWSKPRLAVGAMAAGQRLHGALVGNLWTDPRGRLWLFFDQQRGDARNRITNWFMHCDNPDAAAPTWSEPVCFSEGCTLNKPTVLGNGDWLLPVSDWQATTARVFASTDDGRSWKARGSLQFPDWEFDEHMMVQLRDGRIWMLARTKHQPFESFSADNGATWTTPRQAATVQNINSRFFLRRLASGRILLVKNGSPVERLAQRTHMSAWLSEDEGRTWQGGLLLDERGAVSYPDGFEAPDGLIHILYDWNRHTDAEILLATFREADVLAGTLVSPDARLRLLANKATGPKPEVLSNGVELSLPWPPPFLDPESDEPMPVPYLKYKPRVVPIDVGRQLFVDDFLVEQTTLKRAFHQAEKGAGNPVFTAESDDEISRGACAYLGHGGVFYDPREGLFKLFYVGGWRGALKMATSPDLRVWTRPDLMPGKGNTLLDRSVDDNALWLDLAAAHPDQRLKFLECHRGKLPEGIHEDGHYLYTSADGKTWSPGVRAGQAGDYCSFFFNPFRNRWCFSIKRDNARGRIRYYYESSDFQQGVDWDRAVYWTGTDRLDAPEPEGSYHPAAHGHGCQLYSLNAVAYESLMVGVHYIHRGPDNQTCQEAQRPKLTDLELGFSRDGFHWDRPDRRGFINGSRTEGAWDRAYLHSTTGVFVICDDKLVFPYTGFSGIAADGARGMYAGASIGLATLRRDGFASMTADNNEGTLTTRPITFSGKHLFVNAAIRQGGALRAELLDANGEPIAPFTRDHSVPFTGDRTCVCLEWQHGNDLSALAGWPVRIRFTLQAGGLYAFWVSPDGSGASHGHVAGGGPGLWQFTQR